MPWSNDNGPKASGPWGGGGRGSNGGGGGPWGGGGGRPGGGGGGGQGPNIDDFFKKGQTKLKNVFGERGGGGGLGILLLLIVAAGLWIYASVFTVKPEEQAVVLTFGEFDSIKGPGLNFAPWPIQTYEVEPVLTERSIDIGNPRASTRPQSVASSEGLMLTGDENVVDINFQVVWRIERLDHFLFNLADPDATIKAVSEAAMREIVGQSELLRLLNQDRQSLQSTVQQLIQTTLDRYQAGVTILRVNLDRVDPPPPVLPAFQAVQAAEQEKERLIKDAEAYYNREVAAARGEAQELLERAEGYRAQVVAVAEGEAARFTSIYEEYRVAPDVTRRRLYIETMERVMGQINIVVIDDAAQGGTGVVPLLSVDQLRRRGQN